MIIKRLGNTIAKSQYKIIVHMPGILNIVNTLFQTKPTATSYNQVTTIVFAEVNGVLRRQIKFMKINFNF